MKLFTDPEGELGLSKRGYEFTAGVLHNGPALAALLNPSVNSYKHLNAPPTSSGATWSPNSINYTGNNRTPMVRIPAGDRTEVRFADGAANPYLLQAGLLAADLDGMDNDCAPGARMDFNMYTESYLAPEVAKLPLNLLDALHELEASFGMKEALVPSSPPTSS